jgi:hypothetical protein
MSTRSQRPRARSSPGATRPFEGRRTVPPHAAGVDMGAHESIACVPDGDEQQLGRAFGTDTAALESLADWVSARHPDGRYGINRRVGDCAVGDPGSPGLPLLSAQCPGEQARARPYKRWAGLSVESSAASLGAVTGRLSSRRGPRGPAHPLTPSGPTP